MIEVFASPLPAPDLEAAFVGGRYSMTEEDRLTEEFYNQVEQHLRSLGYTGKRTGKLYYYGPVGDGNAIYMVAERRGSVKLVHMPIGDAWHAPKEVLRGLRQNDIKQFVDSPRLFGEKR